MYKIQHNYPPLYNLQYKYWNIKNKELDTSGSLSWSDIKTANTFITPAICNGQLTREEYILMMSTDKKDITGVTIFEADIVRIILPENKDRYYCIVIYDKDNCTLKFINLLDKREWPLSYYQYAKVLGNFYETHDLYDTIKAQKNIDKWD